MLETMPVVMLEVKPEVMLEWPVQAGD